MIPWIISRLWISKMCGSALGQGRATIRISPCPGITINSQTIAVNGIDGKWKVAWYLTTGSMLSLNILTFQLLPDFCFSHQCSDTSNLSRQGKVVISFLNLVPPLSGSCLLIKSSKRFPLDDWMPGILSKVFVARNFHPLVLRSRYA